MNKDFIYQDSQSPRTLKHDLRRIHDSLKDHPIVTRVGAGALLATGIALGIHSNEVAHDNHCIPSNETVTLGSGESLWTAALEIDDSADPRDTIQHILAVNPDQAKPGHVPKQGESIIIPVCGDDIIDE